MPSPEWLIERGIGETRAALVENGEIVEARVELDGIVPAGSVIEARLADTGTNGRNAVAIGARGAEYLLPGGVSGVSLGATLAVEVTRSIIPGAEPWKRPLARTTDKPAGTSSPLSARLGGRELVLPNARDELSQNGWDDLLDQARTGVVVFAGGELRISPTPAITLIDVDGYLPANELAVLGAAEAGRAIRRLDIGGSIGIDLPTTSSKAERQAAARALDAVLPQPFERTAVNSFGFIQIVRSRSRASLIELVQTRAEFEARALLRRVAFEQIGARTLVAHPAVVGVLEGRADWLSMLARQIGGAVSLRPDAAMPMSAGYAEPA